MHSVASRRTARMDKSSIPASPCWYLCPGLMVSTLPYQPNINSHDTNVGYILHNRLIALLQNAVCVLLTQLGKFLVT